MMDEIERERMMAEIHKRRGQPGIVDEWHAVEMRRRYELEWEKKNEIARVERLVDGRGISPTFLVLGEPARPDLVTVYEGEPVPIAELIWREVAADNRERRRQERREFMAYIRANIKPDELEKFREWLKNNKKIPFPKTRVSLWRNVERFRDSIPSWTLRPAEPATFWEMEMMDRCRIAYVPLRIRDRPFSEMLECSMWTGTDSLPAYVMKGKGQGQSNEGISVRPRQYRRTRRSHATGGDARAGRPAKTRG